MPTAKARDYVPPRPPVRVLILEDDPQDVELMVETLQRAGFAFTFDAEDTPLLFRNRLEASGYDVILADYNLRTWTALDALEILAEVGRDIPLIVVTGTLGDEAAVECIKNGAADYVLKDHLQRLPTVLGHALREKAHREEAARLEGLIRRAKKEWELTFDTVPDPVLVLDHRYRVRRANRAAAALRGQMPSQWIGQPCYQVVHGLAEPHAYCPYVRALASGQEQRGEIIDRELGRVLETTATPLLDSSGTVGGCVHVLHDITGRKRTENGLRETNQTLHALIQTSPLAIVSLDQAGKVMSWNAAAERMFGWQESEVLGNHLPHVPEERQSEFRALFQRVLGGEVLAGVETRRQRKDGSMIDVSISAAPLYDMQGNATGIEALVADISERKRLQAQLFQAQKMEAVGRLAGGLAHDFNNLLTAVTGYSDLLLDRLSGGDSLRKYVEEIRRAGDRGASLTRQLLAFSRRQILAPQVLDLNATVAGVDKMLRRLIGEDIELIIQLEAHLGRVMADPGQVEQVILNLAVNARDAMPSGGKLTFETANVEIDEAYAASHVDVVPARYVMLAVSDTGCGMEPEVLSHVFEPFFTTKEQGKGTGLGLATVYGIVKQSGGHIEVSTEPGRGTRFQIYLPRVERAVTSSGAKRDRTDLPRGTETILLVEDDDVVRSLVREILRSSGYRVLETRGGDQAVSLSDRHRRPIHLLLTDVVMPQMSGRELARSVTRSHPEAKVLYMSGYTDTAVAERGILDAGSAYLQKPFPPEALARKVREILDEARLKGK